MILGGGKIGSKTACDLSKNFNIKLVEKLKDRAFDLAEQLPRYLSDQR